MHFCKVSKEDHRYFLDEGLKPERERTCLRMPSSLERKTVLAKVVPCYSAQ